MVENQPRLCCSLQLLTVEGACPRVEQRYELIRMVWKKTTPLEVVFEGSRELCERLNHIILSVFILFYNSCFIGTSAKLKYQLFDGWGYR